MRSAIRRCRSRTGLLCLLALCGALGLCEGSPTVFGGYQAQVSGSGSFTSATAVVSDSINSVGCVSSPNAAGSITATNQGTCSTYPLNQTAGGAQTVTSTNSGNLPTIPLTGQTQGTCGVQRVSDGAALNFTDSAAGDTGTAQGGANAGVSGPSAFTDSPLGVTFNGSTGYVQTNTQVNGPQTFSLATWFQTTAGSGSGALIGFDSVQGTGTTGNTSDRDLFIGSAGRLSFGIGTGSNQFSIRSPGSYNDNAWHFVVVTVSVVNATSATVTMYVDGTQVQTGSDTNFSSSQPAGAYSGWWHLGWSAVGAFPNAGQNFYGGQMAGAAVFPTALSSSQVSALSGASTQASYATTVTGDSPSNFWPLIDGTTDPGVLVGGSSLGAAGPLGGLSLGLDGSTGYAETVALKPAPQTFSIAAFFQTSSDGSLLQFSSGEAAGAGSADRALWLDSSGDLVFYLNSGTAYELPTSGVNYANGAWHHVVVTVAPGTGGSNATVLMYVDGVLKAGSANDDTAATNQPGSASLGYWQLGYSGGLNHPRPPASSRLTGSLANTTVFGSVLSASQVSALATASSQSAYSSLALADGATEGWPMQDVGATYYQGTIPNVGSSVPCSYLSVTVSGVNNCLAPFKAGGCSGATPIALSSGVSFSSSSFTNTLTFTTYESGSMPTAASGLHVTVPWLLSTSSGGFTGSLLHGATSGFVVL